MEEARKVICLADVGREVQARISSEQHQMRGVRVWKPKHGAYETRVSEALPHRCDVQQCDVCISSQRYETRVSTLEHRTHEVRISQVSSDNDNQQCEVRVSSQ